MSIGAESPARRGMKAVTEKNETKEEALGKQRGWSHRIKNEYSFFKGEGRYS